MMSQQILTGNEVKLIALAAITGVDYVPVDFHGDTILACGTCGRIIHHPDCGLLAHERSRDVSPS